jgi:hypothetical protein
MAAIEPVPISALSGTRRQVARRMAFGLNPPIRRGPEKFSKLAGFAAIAGLCVKSDLL